VEAHLEAHKQGEHNQTSPDYPDYPPTCDALSTASSLKQCSSAYNRNAMQYQLCYDCPPRLTTSPVCEEAVEVLAAAVAAVEAEAPKTQKDVVEAVAATEKKRPTTALRSNLANPTASMKLQPTTCGLQSLECKYDGTWGRSTKWKHMVMTCSPHHAVVF
jgi:hypothetical protein